MTQRRGEVVVIPIAAHGAGVFVIARGGTGGGNHRLFVLVALGGDVLLLGLAAHGAGVMHHAFLAAARLNLDYALVPAVAGGGDHLTLFHNFAAHGADLVAGVTIFGAGGFLGVLQFGFPVAQGRGEMIVIFVAADRADICVVAGGGAGGRHHRLVKPVAGGGDQLALLYDLAAVDADLIAGVTGFGTGGFLLAHQLCIRVLMALYQRLNGGSQAGGSIVHLGLGRRLIGGHRPGLFQRICEIGPGFGGVIVFCKGLRHSDGRIQVRPIRNKGRACGFCHLQVSDGMLRHQIRDKLQLKAPGQLHHLHSVLANAGHRVVVDHGGLVHVVIGGTPSVTKSGDVLAGEVAIVVVGERGEIAAFYGHRHQVGVVRRLFNFHGVLNNGRNFAIVKVHEAKLAENGTHGIVLRLLTACGNRQVLGDGIPGHVPDINTNRNVCISHGNRRRILSGEALELRFHAVCIHGDEAVFRPLNAAGGGSGNLGSFLVLGCVQLHRQRRIGLQAHLGALPAVEVRHQGLAGRVPWGARLGVEHGLEHIVEDILSHICNARAKDHMLEGRIPGKRAPFQSLHTITQVEGLQGVHAGNPRYAGVVALGKHQVLQGAHKGECPAGHGLEVISQGQGLNGSIGKGKGSHRLQGIGQLNLLQAGAAVEGAGAQGLQALLEGDLFQRCDISEGKIRNNFHCGGGDKFLHRVLRRAENELLSAVPQ